MRRAGVAIFDLPVAAAAICGRAYRRYRLARRRSGGGEAPSVPLPDFFIGAHAELVGWKLATRDVERYGIYFPAVELIEPATVFVSTFLVSESLQLFRPATFLVSSSSNG